MEASRPASVIAAIFIFAIVAAERADACTRPYESVERVLVRAHHILELEILSVADVSEEKGKSGRARVRVRQRIRGDLPLEEFTLLGGPFDTCAFGEHFQSFVAGERLFLLLDGPVPEGTNTILVALHPRVFRGTETELRARLAWSRRARTRRLALLARLFPEDYARAGKLHAAYRVSGKLGAGVLNRSSYATLLALEELLRDPDRPLPPRPLPDPDAFTLREVLSRSYADDRTWVTRLKGPPPLPAAVTAALEKAGKESRDAVLATNGRILREYVVRELLQPEERAERFVAAMDEKYLSRPTFPARRLALREADRELSSVNWLLRLADDLPDEIVYRSAWGVGWGACDPKVFEPWLATHGEAVPPAEPRVRVALSLLDPSSASLVRRGLRVARTTRTRTWFLRYFEATGDEERAAGFRKRLETDD